MLAGVVVVAIVSLLLVAQRAARPRTTLLVRVPGTDSFRGADATPDGIAEPGIVLYRFDAPLFFANADVLRDDVSAAVAAARPPGALGGPRPGIGERRGLDGDGDAVRAGRRPPRPGHRPGPRQAEGAGRRLPRTRRALRRGGSRTCLPRGRRCRRGAADDGASGTVGRLIQPRNWLTTAMGMATGQEGAMAVAEREVRATGISSNGGPPGCHAGHRGGRASAAGAVGGERRRPPVLGPVHGGARSSCGASRATRSWSAGSRRDRPRRS